MKINIGQMVEKYRLARRGDGEIILLEGIHAFKHALRFGAVFEEIIYVKDSQLDNFQDNVLKDEERDYILKNGLEVEEEIFEKLLPYKVRSKVVALVKKPQYKKEDLNKEKPLVFLENPANPENIGMAIRVAAAFGAGGLIVNGRISVFSASVIRAGAGLVFALPVFNIKNLEELKDFGQRILISADPYGESLKKIKVPKNSIIIFGTEREGISPELKKLAAFSGPFVHFSLASEPHLRHNLKIGLGSFGLSNPLELAFKINSGFLFWVEP